MLLMPVSLNLSQEQRSYLVNAVELLVRDPTRPASYRAIEPAIDVDLAACACTGPAEACGDMRAGAQLVMQHVI